jgi:hypothetical protein
MHATIRLPLFSAALFALALLSGIHPAAARDTTLHLGIADVLAKNKAELGSDIAFYFGNQSSPPIKRKFDTYVTNRKTNSVGRPDDVVCRWAMLSALIELRNRARELHANAVINIVSYYKKDVFSSEKQYECHAGNIIAGVALRGTMAIVAH